MSFIRNREEELTGYQEIEEWNEAIDLNVDFVMVYGNDPSLYKRIQEYKNHGYQVHLMTGIAWGEYKDYLYGEWDGQSHWEEAQTRENGEIVGHGKDIPYMVPTVSFSDYLGESLRKAVDAGVVAIHLEEPEFWDFSGYSQAFKDEYVIYYREPWKSPQENLAVHYKSAQLKAYLYARTICRIADSIKEYSQKKYGHAVRIYIPTHSLINYMQWKIMSPEGKLNEITSVDGFIAQVWTGTSRTKNMYRGVLAERTFETAYCEFSIMQELIKGSNKQMWFLADPIEDNPNYDWEDYRKNYFETVIASLLHPEVHRYEICPWPNRVFNGKYPKVEKDALVKSKDIPGNYKTQLNNMFQTLGNMEQSNYYFSKNNDIRLGIALSDTGLYQRSYPDFTSFKSETISEEQLDFYSSDAFPMFYGLSLPLIKYGLPIRCVQIDNVLRIPNYLQDLKYLVLSYDFMKPVLPGVNSEIANWVQNGGTLIYVGDDQDPYNSISSWWNYKGETNKTPWQNLQNALTISAKHGIENAVGKGMVYFFSRNPAEICEDNNIEFEYRQLVTKALNQKDDVWQETNQFMLSRGPYIISATMAETSNKIHKLTGNYINLMSSSFEYLTELLIQPGGNALLYNLDYDKSDSVEIVGTTARVLNLNENEETIALKLKTTSSVKSHLVLTNIRTVKSVNIKNGEQNISINDFTYHKKIGLLSVNYSGTGSILEIEIRK